MAPHQGGRWADPQPVPLPRQPRPAPRAWRSAAHRTADDPCTPRHPEGKIAVAEILATPSLHTRVCGAYVQVNKLERCSINEMHQC